MLTIVDIGISNLESVRQAFKRIGYPTHVTASPMELAAARVIVLPGVGAFGDAKDQLDARNLSDVIRAHATAGKPILGICLGMQLLASTSDEGGNRGGLGLIPGKSVRLAPKDEQLRVPNIGWCDVYPQPKSVLFADLVAGTPLYFVHSYHVRCDDPANVSAVGRVGQNSFNAAVEHENLFGVQFHPEKSQDAGLDILFAFCRHVERLGALD